MPFRQSPFAAYKAAAGLARYWRHNEKTQFLPSWPIKRLAAGFIRAALQIHSD